MKITNQLTIKKLSPEDYSDFYECMHEIYFSTYGSYWQDGGVWYFEQQYNKENVLKESSSSDSEYYAVYFNDTLIGALRLVWNEDPRSKRDASYLKVHRLYIATHHQGKGIGKTLLTWVENNAKQKNCKYVWLEVMERQEQAVQFYVQQGYVLQHKRRLEYLLFKEEYRGIYIAEKEL